MVSLFGKSTVALSNSSLSHRNFLLKTTMSVKTDHVIVMPNVGTHQDHSHVHVMLDIQEMASLVKVRNIIICVYVHKSRTIL
jgi:hypothetical protein